MTTKKINPPVYKLAVTERQLNLIVEATDLYCFLLLGKFENPLWNLFTSRDIDYEQFHDACAALKKIVFPELDRHGGYGIGWKEGDRRQEKAQIAYEIEAMIRHELWKRDSGRESFTTCASSPLHYSPEHLIAVEDFNSDLPITAGADDENERNRI